ncbi:MAG: hypothetical protein ACREJ0_26640 [Geminicoccaceae bacterium]
MRPMFAALMFAYGVIGIADLGLASIYVPGHIRDGIYIRPHFVSAPKRDYRAWPAERGVIEPKPHQQPPLLDLAPSTDRTKLGEAS